MAFSRKNSKHKRSISYSGGILSTFSTQNGLSCSSDTKLEDEMQTRPRTASTLSSATGTGEIEQTSPTPTLRPHANIRSAGSSNQLKNLFKYGSLTADTLNPPPSHSITRKSAMVTIEPISPLPAADTAKSSDNFSFNVSQHQTTQQIADTLNVIEQGLYILRSI